MRFYTLMLLGFLFFVSCESEVAEPNNENCSSFYTSDVKPIIDANCVECHNADSPARADLSSLAGLQANATEVKKKVVNRSMPKTGILTEQEIALISCWISDGALDN